MSLEELYGVKPSKHIHKDAGIVKSDEGKAEMEHLRSEYFKKYMRKDGGSKE